MSASLKFDFQKKKRTITFFWSRLSKIHKKTQFCMWQLHFLKQGETRTRHGPIPHPLKFQSKSPFAHCDTYTCDYLQHIILSFYLINFQLNLDFPFKFLVFFFNAKSPSVSQRSISQENDFEKSKNPSPFFFFLFFFFLFSFFFFFLKRLK